MVNTSILEQLLHPGSKAGGCKEMVGAVESRLEGRKWRENTGRVVEIWLG